MGCKISVEGDIYSYGIILLEIITGRRPTDDMFKDGVNIRNFVESSLPLNIHNQISLDIMKVKTEDKK